MSYEIPLYGEKILICPLKQSNVEKYLSTYREVSVFSAIYDKIPQLWDNMRKDIEAYAAGGRDGDIRYLVVEKESGQECGYIELDYSDQDMPQVNIAILEKYRGNGYGFEAARLACENALKNEGVKCIIWKAFRSNRASCKIAEKLGGTAIVEGKNIITEAVQAAGLQIDLKELEETFEMAVYEIKRKS